jgi:hypothetical protein
MDEPVAEFAKWIPTLKQGKELRKQIMSTAIAP